MFDLIERNRATSARRLGTVVLSIVAHLIIVGLIILVPLLYFSDELPEPREVIGAFVASAPAPPPPPAPAPPARPAPPEPKPIPTTGRELPPVVPPDTIDVPAVPTTPVSTLGTTSLFGGIAGGVAGGIPGGTFGGLPGAPPGGEGQGPVRVGGRIKAPDLIHRVEPRYPDIARQARAQGTVILEATVDKTGQVQSVQVLRGSPVLKRAAVDAVKQWRYSPLMLNGEATPFVVTVTVTFHLQ